MTTADGQTKNKGNEGSKYKDPDYIRVTTALGYIHYDPDNRLQKWSINKHKDFYEYQEGMRISAERGSDVDNAIKCILEKKNFELKEELWPYIDAFRKWQEEWPFEVTDCDKEVHNEELKFVGTLDIRGKLKGKDVIIDIKTGRPLRNQDGTKKYEVFPKQLWQTAAYRYATGAEENWILRLFDDGAFKFVQDINYDNSLAIFKHGLSLARLLK